MIAGLVIGCAGQPRDPLGLSDGEGGLSGRSNRASPLIGSWQVVLLVRIDSDVQRWQTRWSFGADSRCHFERTTRSLAEGISRTVTRDGSYVDRGQDAVVTFTDRTTATLPYSVPLNSTRLLIIEGLQYERIE